MAASPPRLGFNQRKGSRNRVAPGTALKRPKASCGGNHAFIPGTGQGTFAEARKRLRSRGSPLVERNLAMLRNAGLLDRWPTIAGGAKGIRNPTRGDAPMGNGRLV
ncbi:MAG: hypothetical protein CM15mP77_4190 [Synechococcus sp.]|nr:MAG: hypothetical protein CM15mP77_4190 [Synechococcus sp.]